MPQNLPVSTKVTPPSEVFFSPYASATPYVVGILTVNSEYSTPLLTLMLPPSMLSRSLEATCKVGDIDVESKSTNMRQ